MLAYISRRILLSALTMLAMSAITFLVISLPEGDFVDKQIEELRRGATPFNRDMEEQLREYYGLDKPAVVQYFNWVFRIVTKLEFGHTFGEIAFSSDTGGGGNAGYRRNAPVREVIQEPLLLTISLMAFTIGLTWIMGIPIGIYSAVRQHTIGDYVFTFVGFSGLAVPDFLLGLVLMYLFYAYFTMSVGGLFTGHLQDAAWSVEKVIDLLKHLIIPAVVLGTSGTAGLIRIMRNNLLDELGKPYVVTARAKGLSGTRLVIKYPVRVAINPFISGIGQTLPALVGGSVIVSVVLSLPTLGPILLGSVMSLDTHMAGAIILMLGLLTVIGILISDILLMIVDPRIKLYR